MFSFDIKKVDLDKKLGKGSYGTIYTYKKTHEDQRYVAKVAHTDDVNILLGYFQEIVLGFSCKHSNVLPVRGYYMDFDPKNNLWDVYIKLDRMECSLKSKIEQHQYEGKNLSEEEIVRYFYELSCGLEYLHDQGIAHRDIKPDNILISKDQKLKIAEIGVGKFMGDEATYLAGTIEGTRLYIAPEIFKKEKISRRKKKDFFRADIWSLGLVMAELCLQRIGIYDIFQPGDVNALDMKNKLKRLEGQKYNKALLDLISSLINIDPSQRKSLKDVQRILKQSYPNLLKSWGEEFHQKKSPLGSCSAEIEEVKMKQPKLSTEQINKDLEDFYQSYRNKFDIEFFKGEVKMEQKQSFEYENTIFQNLMDYATYKLTNDQNIEQFKMTLGIDGSRSNNLEVNDEMIMELSKQIGLKLKNVQRLDLTFENCLGITDVGVKELARQIGSNLKNILQLKLIFNGDSSDITDDGVSELAQQIGNLANMLQLHLKFHGSKGITDNGVRKLAQQLKSNLQNIQQLHLNFSGTSVTQDEKDDLKRLMEFIPKFDIN